MSPFLQTPTVREDLEERYKKLRTKYGLEEIKKKPVVEQTPKRELRFEPTPRGQRLLPGKRQLVSEEELQEFWGGKVPPIVRVQKFLETPIVEKTTGKILETALYPPWQAIQIPLNYAVAKARGERITPETFVTNRSLREFEKFRTFTEGPSYTTAFKTALKHSIPSLARKQIEPIIEQMSPEIISSLTEGGVLLGGFIGAGKATALAKEAIGTRLGERVIQGYAGFEYLRPTIGSEGIPALKNAVRETFRKAGTEKSLWRLLLASARKIPQKVVPTFRQLALQDIPGTQLTLPGVRGARGAALVPGKQDLINAIRAVRPTLKDVDLAKMSVTGLMNIATRLKISIPVAPPQAPEVAKRGIPEPLSAEEAVSKGMSAEEFIKIKLTSKESYDKLIEKGQTRYEQEQKIIPREIKRIIPESGKQYLATPRTRGRDFHTNLKKTNETHPYGQAVEVKEPQFYTDPKIKLFLSSDSSAGAAVTIEGDLVAVFKKPTSKQDINLILNQASKQALTLDAYDTNDKLPNLYARHGFRPVARMRFNKERAPKNWDYTKFGEPDVVFMIRDVEGITGLSEIPSETLGGYSSIKDNIPVFENYDDLIKYRDSILRKKKISQLLSEYEKAKAVAPPAVAPPVVTPPAKRLTAELRAQRLKIIADQLTKLAEVAPHLITPKQQAYIHILKEKKMLTDRQYSRLLKVFTGKRTVAYKTPTGKIKKKAMKKEEASEAIRAIEGVVKPAWFRERPPVIPREKALVPYGFFEREFRKLGFGARFLSPSLVFRRAGVPEFNFLIKAMESARKAINNKLMDIRDWQKFLGIKGIFIPIERGIKAISLGRRAGPIEQQSAKLFRAVNNPEEFAEPLTDKEKTVIEAFKKDADEYANRLDELLAREGKPLVNRRKNYIPNLLTETARLAVEARKPFPEELAVILQYATPTQKFDPFLLQRVGGLPIKEDFWTAWRAMISVHEKKLALDPALRFVSDFIKVFTKPTVGEPKLPVSVVNYTRRLMGRLLGRPSEQAQAIATSLEGLLNKVFLIDKWKHRRITVEVPEEIQLAKRELEIVIPRLRITPQQVQRASGFLKSINYGFNLALSVPFYLLNRTQPITAFAKMKGGLFKALDANYYGLVRAYLDIVRPSKWKYWKREGVLTGMETLITEEFGYHNIILQSVAKVSEFLNRVQVTYMKMRNLAQIDKIHGPEARRLGIELTDQINFIWGIEQTPEAFANPIGNLYYQYMTFCLKHGELLHDLARDTNIKRLLPDFWEAFKKGKTTDFFRELKNEDRGAFIRWAIYSSALASILGVLGANMWDELLKGWMPHQISSMGRVVEGIKEGDPWKIYTGIAGMVVPPAISGLLRKQIVPGGRQFQRLIEVMRTNEWRRFFWGARARKEPGEEWEKKLSPELRKKYKQLQQKYGLSDTRITQKQRLNPELQKKYDRLRKKYNLQVK